MFLTGLGKFIEILPAWMRNSVILLLCGIGIGVSYMGFSTWLDAAEAFAKDAQAKVAALKTELDKVNVKVTAGLMV